MYMFIKAGGGGKPTGAIAAMIDSSFGDYDKFRAEFVKAANTAFGSGYVLIFVLFIENYLLCL